jgi:DNA-directed RNA polymerase subunit RPC12/RpoP
MDIQQYIDVEPFEQFYQFDWHAEQINDRSYWCMHCGTALDSPDGICIDCAAELDLEIEEIWL